VREARITLVNTNRAPCFEEGSVVLARAKQRIESAARDKPDLILLTELFANAPQKTTRKAALEAAETVPGPVFEEMASLAGRFRTYIAFGLLRRKGNSLFNSQVLVDRDGQGAWIFDKVTPLPGEINGCGISPGKRTQPFDTDFGRVGGAVCFDINFNELAERYFRRAVELVLFSSAFPGGKLLDAWSVRYGFAIASCTWYDTNRVIDCTGTTLARTSDLLPTATAVLNLNRRVVHMDGNLGSLEKMRTRYCGDVLVEDLRDEATCAITSLKKGLEVQALIKEFRIETLPAYFDRCRRVRERHGGLAVQSWGGHKGPPLRAAAN